MALDQGKPFVEQVEAFVERGEQLGGSHSGW